MCIYVYNAQVFVCVYTFVCMLKSTSGGVPIFASPALRIWVCTTGPGILPGWGVQLLVLNLLTERSLQSPELPSTAKNNLHSCNLLWEWSVRWKQKFLNRAVLSRKALSRQLIQEDGSLYRTPEAKENHKVPSRYNRRTGVDVATKSTWEPMICCLLNNHTQVELYICPHPWDAGDCITKVHL